MKPETQTPPRIAQLLLRASTPARDRAVILGDLQEEYLEICGTRGRGVARRWYWRQSLGSIVPGLGRKLLWTSTRAATRPTTAGIGTVEGLSSDVRYALRSLRRGPVFACAAIITLALGLGANIAVFTMSNAVFLRPPSGVEAPGDLFRLALTRSQGVESSLAYPDVADLREQTEASQVVAYSGTAVNFGDGTASRRVRAALVSWNYFDVLGVQPVSGRFFARDEDEVPGAKPVAVVGHSFWTESLGADPKAIGSTIRLNGAEFTVLGVVEPGFGGVDRFERQEIFAPMMMQQTLRPRRFPFLERRDALWLQAFGRVAENSSLEQARVEIESLSKTLAEQYPETNKDRFLTVYADINLEPGDAREAAPIVIILTAFAAMVLLIACANVGNLCLARANERHGEVALRLALGANRGHIIKQLMAEAVLLSGAGVLGGLAIAYGCRRMLLRLLEGVDHLDASFDWRVFGFAILAGLLSALVFGTVPALRSSVRVNRNSRRGSRLRSAFVVAQIALAALLLVMSGLFVETLRRMSLVEPGFDEEGVVVAELDLNLQGYSDDEALVFSQTLLQRARSLPGADDAAIAATVPLSGSSESTSLGIEGVEPPEGRLGIPVAVNRASSDYFQTMGIALRRGRLFEASDDRSESRAAVISEAFAARFWPDSQALGRSLTYGPPDQRQTFSVVGVVADLAHGRLGERPRPFVYLPHARFPLGGNGVTPQDES